MANNYRYIGKDTPRKDARDIVTGKAQYLDDVHLPNMLIGKVLRSPLPHANIKRIDVSRAAALPSVHAVLTYKDVTDAIWGIPNHMKLLDKKVRFVGDAVALVAADTAEIADEAVELIEVEYEPLAACYDVEEAIKPGQPQLYDQYPNNIIPQISKLLQNVIKGDVDKGFAEADEIIEGTGFYECFPNPLPPEPPGVIAYWENPDKLVAYVATQSLGLNKYLAQPFFRMANTQFIATQCGGSYGTKNANLTPIGFAAELSKATRRPVKIYYTKEEHLAAYSLRISCRINARVGIKKDGTVTAVTGDWIVNTGSGSEAGPHEIAVGCGELQLALRCPNWNLRSKLVVTNRAPTGIVRGYGGQELESSILPIMGMAMEKAGVNDKVVAVIGDSTFLHSGITGLVNAVYNKGQITLIILDNRTTAMTGHQEHPGTGITAQGKETRAIELEPLTRGIGVNNVTVVDAWDLKTLKASVKSSLDSSELSVIIVHGACSVHVPRRCNPRVIDADRCNQCNLCLILGCPAIQKEPGQIYIDTSLCVGDSCTLCQQLCPRQAISPQESTYTGKTE